MTAFRCILTLWMESRSAVDGVAIAKGKVACFRCGAGQYGFRFVQTDDMPDLIRGCRQFDVEVLAPGNRKDAVALLRSAHLEDREIEFAYLGSGLLQVGHSCLFLSRPSPRTGWPAAPAPA